MDNLQKIFSNLFEVNSSSKKKLVAFANDHLIRLMKIDSQLYSKLIEQTAQLIKNLEDEFDKKKPLKPLITKLGQQLTKNAIFIAYQNDENSNAIEDFFDIKILQKKVSKKTSKHIVNAYSKIDVDCSDGYTPEKRVRIMTKGTVTISVQLSCKGKAVGKTFKVAPRKILDKLFSDFNGNADSIQITNMYSKDCMCLLQEIV
jgi:hypothetical protein